MDGRVSYNSLAEAVEALNKYAQELDDPIDQFTRETSTSIGEDGASAWGGTAAEMAVPVLQKIKADIVQLQHMTGEFSENVNKSLAGYQAQDAAAKSAMDNVVG